MGLGRLLPFVAILTCGMLAVACGSRRSDRPGALAAAPTVPAPPCADTTPPCCDCRRWAKTPPPQDDAARNVTRAHVASLLELLDDRLALMPQVARYKYANDLPISAPERERDLLAALTVEASAHGLDGALVCSLFRAQIEVSKQIQRKRIDAWKARGAARTADGPELGSEIRPRIDEIGRQVLVELDALQDVPPCETACAAAALAATYLTQPDLSAAWRKAVVAPLGRVGAQCGRSPSARSRSPRAGQR